MLTTLGHSSVVAANGEQALEALDGGDFDMVFMDCQMPVLDGFSATREIRRRESGSEAHIPIVALTANAMEGDRERCVAAGMDGFITKPVRQAELGRAIDERVHGPLGY
jgi:two-component system sensor histidine kinase/response regulator